MSFFNDDIRGTGYGPNPDQQPPPNNAGKVVATCRGSLLLGSGCGICPKCKGELASMALEVKPNDKPKYSQRPVADIVLKELDDLISGIDSVTGRELSAEDMKLLASSVKLNFLRYMRNER